MSSFVDSSWLGGVRTWWRSWVHSRVCCREYGVHKMTGVYSRWCIWYVRYVFVLDVDQLDL